MTSPIDGAAGSATPSSAGDEFAGVAAILPALNEEAGLPLVLAALRPLRLGRIVVVDNGSTDATAAVARVGGAEVVAEPRRGYGSACLRGLAALAAAPPKAVLFLDADFSDHPDLAGELLRPILANEADFVLGSRMRGQREPGAMPPQSRFGNWLACNLIRWLRRAEYTDLGPFRAVGWDALQRLGMQDRGFGWTVEMQLKAAALGLRVREVPTPYRRRVGRSKISGTWAGSAKAGVCILYWIAKYAFAAPPRQAKPQTNSRKEDSANRPPLPTPTP